MKMKKLNLQLFAGGHSVTVYKDEHMTTASASSTSDVQAEATVTLTLTPATGYEVDEVEVIAGGVTIEEEGETTSFEMGSENVVLFVKSKANNKYIVTEECMANVNDTKTVLHKNMVVNVTPNGVPYKIDSDGTSVTVDAAIQNLIDTGVLQKI